VTARYSGLGALFEPATVQEATVSRADAWLPSSGYACRDARAAFWCSCIAEHNSLRCHERRRASVLGILEEGRALKDAAGGRAQRPTSTGVVSWPWSGASRAVSVRVYALEVDSTLSVACVTA